MFLPAVYIGVVLWKRSVGVPRLCFLTCGFLTDTGGSSPVPGTGVVGCQRSVSYVNLCYVSHVHASCDDSVVLA